MIRGSSRCSGAALGALCWASAMLGCAGRERGPVFPTSLEFPEAPRRAPSFAPDSGGTALGEGELASGVGIERLAVPLDPEQARKLVGRFFSAVTLESSQDLFPLFSRQAWILSEGSRQPAQALWRARLAQLDYKSLAGRVVASPRSLRTYTWTAAERARAEGVAPPASPEEVVVVADLQLSWVGKTRLFGDRLAFRLRPRAEQTSYEIAEIAEDFRLP